MLPAHCPRIERRNGGACAQPGENSIGSAAAAVVVRLVRHLSCRCCSSECSAVQCARHSYLSRSQLLLSINIDVILSRLDEHTDRTTTRKKRAATTTIRVASAAAAASVQQRHRRTHPSHPATRILPAGRTMLNVACLGVNNRKCPLSCSGSGRRREQRQTNARQSHRARKRVSIRRLRRSFFQSVRGKQ